MVVVDLHCRFALQIYCCAVELYKFALPFTAKYSESETLHLQLLDFLSRREWRKSFLQYVGVVLICTDFRVELQDSNAGSLWCLLLTYWGKDRQGSTTQWLPKTIVNWTCVFKDSADPLLLPEVYFVSCTYKGPALLAQRTSFWRGHGEQGAEQHLLWVCQRNKNI